MLQKNRYLFWGGSRSASSDLLRLFVLDITVDGAALLTGLNH